MNDDTSSAVSTGNGITNNPVIIILTTNKTGTPHVLTVNGQTATIGSAIPIFTISKEKTHEILNDPASKRTIKFNVPESQGEPVDGTHPADPAGKITSPGDSDEVKLYKVTATSTGITPKATFSPTAIGGDGVYLLPGENYRN